MAKGKKIVADSAVNSSGNLSRFSGFATGYDAHRPAPPPVLLEILTKLAGVQNPALVVDLGSGTGLSTRVWANRAVQVIGVEPNDDMRQQAIAATPPEMSNVQYIAASSHQIGLPDACADIVTCSQSLHWMEPVSTFAEVTRILRSDGVFAAYDCDWPPTMNWQAEAAYRTFMGEIRRIEQEHHLAPDVMDWEKSEHLSRMKASGRFRYVKEICVHHTEMGNAARMVGIALSQGSVQTVLKAGWSEDAMGLSTFRAAMQHLLGDTPSLWYWTYRVRLGIK